MVIETDVVQLVLSRLRTEPLPQENAAQVCYLLGWQEALCAVAEALDVSVAPAKKIAPAVPQPALWAD